MSTISEKGSLQATYTYDTNGNNLTKSTPAHGEDKASSTVYSYNGFNQLIGLTVDGTTVAYAYNAQGIRTAKRVNTLRTAFLLDGSNVVAEVQNNTVTDNYLRGVNLICRETNSETEYYLFNAHGDVVTTTNPNGTINQEYDYDAFGNEKDPDVLDANPFRYCGEYLDFETGDYYLRARYYDPTIGRFTQQDTHWNTANMIYGDNPKKINEREDKLGLKTYSHAPQITAVMQSGNLYVYGLSNPVWYCDTSGQIVGLVLLTIGTIKVTADMVIAILGLGATLLAAFKLTQAFASDLADYIRREEAAKRRREDAVEAQAVASASTVAAAPSAPDPNDDESNSFKERTIEITTKAKNQIKKLSRETKKQYDKVIQALKSGDLRGLNNHPLGSNRAGQWAVDLKGSDANRGSMRIIYTIKNGVVTIVEIIFNHKY